MWSLKNAPREHQLSGRGKNDESTSGIIKKTRGDTENVINPQCNTAFNSVHFCSTYFKQEWDRIMRGIKNNKDDQKVIFCTRRQKIIKQTWKKKKEKSERKS